MWLYRYLDNKGLPLGWVDIGTEAREPLNIVVYLSKSVQNLKKLV
jgi:hypothetical protein